MTDNTKHTPTPWDFIPGAGYCDPSITADGRVIAELRGDPSLFNQADKQAYANARFIVRAVNSHAAMLNTLQSIADAIDEAVNQKIRTGRMPPIGKLLSEIQDGANAALALAGDA